MLDQETIDYVAITRVQSAYADVVNRRAWPELAELFLPEAVVHVDTVTNPVIELPGPKAVGEFIGNAIERFEFFEFVILNTRVELQVDGDPDRASARVFMQELRQDAANGAWTTAYGLYRDDYARRDDRWWFARRRYQSLARTAPSTAVFPLPSD